MKTIDDLCVDHAYYCHTQNFYSNEAAYYFDNWQEFFDEWEDSDMGMNLVFRWDVKKTDPVDYEEGEDRGGYGDYWMEIFIMGQRKGLFMPITIKTVTDEDVSSINAFLAPRFEYLKEMWLPFVTYK